MLPKFVPIPDPGLVDRVTDVISKNPTGVKYASPSLNSSIEEGSSGLGGCAGVAVVVAGGVKLGASAGAAGTIGFALATSPIAG
jgi:hypothetical protein